MILLGVWTKEARAQLTPQQKQEIHTHYQQATRAYDLGKYQEAIDEYQKVYEIDGDPVMLYNIGQAYRLNDQPQESIHFYRRYLQRSPEARNRDDVERKIAVQEKLIEDRRKAAAAVSPPPPKKEPPPPPPKVAPPPPPPPAPVVVAPPPPPPPPEPSAARRVVGWTMIGVGVAADVVAVIEGIRAKDKGDQLTLNSMKAGHPAFDATQQQLQSEGKTANVIAIVSGIAGTAVAVTGAIILITNGSSSSDETGTTPAATPATTVSFAPWLAPGLVGGGMGLRF
ncbi:MAG TPA: tetratricopeptide repeat protein [Polyangia bacterium]